MQLNKHAECWVVISFITPTTVITSFFHINFRGITCSVNVFMKQKVLSFSIRRKMIILSWSRKKLAKLLSTIIKSTCPNLTAKWVHLKLPRKYYIMKVFPGNSMFLIRSYSQTLLNSRYKTLSETWVLKRNAFIELLSAYFACRFA